MSISRRSFAAGSLAMLPSLASSQTTLKARIKVDTERVIGDIDPKIYGNFIEHLGRCIEGGIFEEGSPLSDANGFRKDVLDAVRKMNVPILRWPGGNFVSNYNWRDGIGPRDQRPPRLEMAWGTTESNRFGTHEFLDYCRVLGTEPYICVNLGTGTMTEAQQWLEYCNSPVDSAVTRLRKQNGRAEPWKVKYWSLGNEVDGSWQMGHRNAEDYAKYALETAKMMRWTDPSIELIAVGASFVPGADWANWNRILIEYLKYHIDYLSLHLYVGNRDNDYYDYLATSVDLDDKIEINEGIIRAGVLGPEHGGTPRPSFVDKPRKIHISFDEWNVWYRARGPSQRGRRILEERYNLEDALVVASFLNCFLNHAHIVKMANLAQLVNVIAPIFTNEKGLFLQTIYYPLQLFANNSRGKALQLFSECPTYKCKRFDAVPYLHSSAAFDRDTLVLNVINRHKDEAVETSVVLEDKRFAGPVEISEVNGPDLKSENSFDSAPVRAVPRAMKADGNTLRVRLAPHSYTMIKARLTSS